jgi:hypothetical protein
MSDMNEATYGVANRAVNQERARLPDTAEKIASAVIATLDRETAGDETARAMAQVMYDAMMAVMQNVTDVTIVSFATARAYPKAVRAATKAMVAHAKIIPNIMEDIDAAVGEKLKD